MQYHLEDLGSAVLLIREVDETCDQAALRLAMIGILTVADLSSASVEAITSAFPEAPRDQYV